MKNLTPTEALAELQRRLRDRTDTVPEGWYTTKTLAEQWGISLAGASKRINQMVSANMCEMSSFTIHTGTTIRAVPHYRFYS